MTIEDRDPIDVHRDRVREFMRPGGPLGLDSPHASNRNPAWFPTGNVAEPTRERRALHDRLLAEYRAEYPHARTERRAVVLAGPPGAGKGYTQRHVLGLDQNAWLAIDPDKFKAKLLREARDDGSYESFIKPAQITERENAGERFYPLELSSLVHEESSYLANRLRTAALRDGVNVVIDSVLSNPDKAELLGGQLAAAGYDVEVVDVEVPFEVSEAQIRQRWRDDYVAALTSGDLTPATDLLGGRWVPSQFARDVYDQDLTGRARSQESAERLAATCPTVTRHRRYWIPEAGADRVLEVDRTRLRPGGAFMPTALVRPADRGADEPAAPIAQTRTPEVAPPAPRQHGPQQ